MFNRLTWSAVAFALTLGLTSGVDLAWAQGTIKIPYTDPLSGPFAQVGDQNLQMLTMCRTLMGDPELVIIDEPTEGLAPKLVAQVAQLLDEIARRGVSILLVEQKLTIALKSSHRLYVMGHGRIVFEGTPADLAANEAVRKERLEV